MSQYVIEIPYERKKKCKKIGLQLNNMEDVNTLFLCYNRKQKRIIFYLECGEACIDNIHNSEKYVGLRVECVKNFWNELKIKDWIIYSFVYGNESYNRIMISRIFKFE